MSNMSLNKIIINNPIIYRLDFQNYMLSFDVSTETTSMLSIDLSKTSDDEIKIVSSYTIYSKFKDSMKNVTNKNTKAVKFYSYAGGKEITRLVNGSTRMSHLDYTPFNGSLFSSIILPELNDNDKLYLLFDSYSELNTIDCPLMKKELINKDFNMMLKNIKTHCEDKKINIIMLFDNKLYDELIKYEPTFNLLIQSSHIYDPATNKFVTNYNINQHTCKTNLCNYACDLIFGKVVGGQTHEFTGIINPVDCTIIDVFTNNKNHVFTNRTSGLSISGNGTSSINMIIKSNNELLNDIKIIEVTSGVELINLSINSNVKVHKNTNILLKLIKIREYNSILNNLLSRTNKEEIKQYMKTNIEETFNWEFNFYESINFSELEEDIKNQVTNNIILLYDTTLNHLLTMKSLFYNKRLITDCNGGIHREATEHYYPYDNDFISSALPKVPLKRQKNYIDRITSEL